MLFSSVLKNSKSPAFKISLFKFSLDFFLLVLKQRKQILLPQLGWLLVMEPIQVLLKANSNLSETNVHLKNYYFYHLGLICSLKYLLEACRSPSWKTVQNSCLCLIAHCIKTMCACASRKPKS